MRRFQDLLLLCILALAMLLPAASSEAAVAEDLYLLPPTDGTWTFTTFTPEAAEPILVEPFDVVVPRFMWTWDVSRSPTDWRLTPDDRVEATLFLEGLERVVPVSEPRADPHEIGRIKVQVDLFIAGDTTSDTGIFQYLIDPSSYGNATGHVMLDPRPLGGGIEEVTVVLEAADTFEVAKNLDVALRVSVSGVTPAEERPRIALGGTESPSRFLVSSFPWAELHEQERVEKERRACLERILLKESCETPPAPEGPVDAAESPALGVPLAVLALIGAAVSSRGRGRRKLR